MTKRFLYFFILFLLLFITCSPSLADNQVLLSRRFLCEDDRISFVTYSEGQLWGLFESGLYTLDNTGKKTQVIAASDLPSDIVAVISDGGTIYASVYSDNQGLLVPLADKDGCSLNQTILLPEDVSPESMQSCILRNGFLYYPISETASSDASVVRVSLADSSRCSITIKDLADFDVMGDGNILALTKPSGWQESSSLLQIVIPETGKREEWMKLDDSGCPSDILYNSAADTVYFIGQREISAAQKGFQPIPAGISSALDIRSVCLIPGGLALANGITLNLYSFSSDPAGQRTVLNICGPYAEDEFFTAFYNSHPTTDIRTIDSPLDSPEERFLRDMLTQNPEIDIYILQNLNLLSIIKSKGYYADLSVSDVIKEKTGRMYAPFIQAFTEKDKIAAFPHPWYVFFSSVGYNRELFDELGFTVPATWNEYFDFCIEWKEYYEDLYPEISVNPFEHDISFVSLLAHYDDEITRSGVMADYRCDELKSVLEKYLKVKELYRAADYSGTPLFYDYDLQTLSGKAGKYKLLPLTFMKDSDPIYTPMAEDVCYFVVNPFGEHCSEAVECVALAKDPTRMNDPSIYTEIPDLPLENTYYEDGLQMYNDTLEMLKNQRKKAGDDPLQAMEIDEQIEQTTKELQDYKANGRWWLTAEDMVPYRELMNHVYFSDFNPIRELYANDPLFFEQITKETLPQFLESLNDKIRMIRLEQGS